MTKSDAANRFRVGIGAVLAGAALLLATPQRLRAADLGEAGYDRLAALKAQFGTLQVKTAEQVGAVGDGRTDDAPALQAWLDTPHAVLQLTPHRVYRLGHSLVLHSDSAIVGYGAPTGVLRMSAADFNCDAAAGCRYDVDPHADAILFRGKGAPLQNVVLDDFAILGDGRAQQGKTLAAISCSNVAGLRISRLDISHLSNAIGIRCSGVSGSSSIDHNVIHDFADDTPTAIPKVISAILIDPDSSGKTPPTTHLAITANKIANIRYGPAYVAHYDQQASGIVTIAGSTGITATGNVVVGTGQGVDWHTSKGRVAGNIVKDADLFCLKFIHGASDNVVTGNALDGCGIAGISLGGGNNAIDVARNRIYGNTIRHVDPHGVHAKNNSAGILLLRSSASGVNADNQIGPNDIDVGNGDWVIGDLADGDHGNVLVDAGTKPGRSGRFKVLSNSDVTR